MSTSFRRRWLNLNSALIINDQSAGVSAQPRVANDVVNVANSIVQEDCGAMAASRDVTDENTATSWALTAAQNLDLVSRMRPSHAQIPKADTRSRLRAQAAVPRMVEIQLKLCREGLRSQLL